VLNTLTRYVFSGTPATAEKTVPVTWCDGDRLSLEGIRALLGGFAGWFAEAALGNAKTSAPFDYSGLLTESVLLGPPATRFPNTTSNGMARRRNSKIRMRRMAFRRESCCDLSILRTPR
jgi:hypothetical protein